jgi:hypothetical protein
VVSLLDYPWGWSSNRKPNRAKHDKIVMLEVQTVMRRGVKILFVDAKGFGRPDVIYQNSDGKTIGLDYKTKNGKLVKTEIEFK